MITSINTIWEEREDFGIITLNNPPENYLKSPVFMDRDFFIEKTSNKKLKGIVITGMGRHFSAGADINSIKQLLDNEESLSAEMNKGKELLTSIENLTIPVIAAIRGVCFGGGLEIALACHLRVCKSNSIFAFPETNHNIMPGLGGTIRISNLLPTSKSRELVLSGSILDAEEAKKLNLVDHIVEDSKPLDFALQLLHKMTDNKDIEVIRSVMKSISNSRKLPYEEAMIEETKMFCKLALKNLTPSK